MRVIVVVEPRSSSGRQSSSAIVRRAQWITPVVQTISSEEAPEVELRRQCGDDRERAEPLLIKRFGANCEPNGSRLLVVGRVPGQSVYLWWLVLRLVVIGHLS